MVITLKRLLPWIAWILATLTYFQQYYLRVSVSTLSDKLIIEFFLSMQELTDLTIVFFFAYVVMLPFAGVLLDRFGVKKVLPLAMFVISIACFIFSSANSMISLTIARMLMGSAASFCLIGILSVVRGYFRSSLFPLLSGLSISFGSLGAIAGGWLLLHESHIYDWRYLMLGSGFFSLVVGILFYIVVDHEKTHIQVHDGLKKFIIDIKLFLENKLNWFVGIYAGFMLTPVLVFASFWSTPYLRVIYQLSEDTAEYLTAYIFIGYAIGAPLLSLLAQKFGLRLMMISSAALVTLAIIILDFHLLPLQFVPLCFLIQGITAGSFNLSTIYIKLTTPSDIAASSFSFNTMLSQLVGSILLWSLSKLIYSWHGVAIVKKNAIYSSVVLQHAMFILLAISMLAIVIACFLKVPQEIDHC